MCRVLNSHCFLMVGMVIKLVTHPTKRELRKTLGHMGSSWRCTHFLSAPHRFTFVWGKRIYAKNGESDFDLPGKTAGKKPALKLVGWWGSGWLETMLEGGWYLNNGRGTLRPPKLRRTVCGLEFRPHFLVKKRTGYVFQPCKNAISTGATEPDFSSPSVAFWFASSFFWEHIPAGNLRCRYQE